MPKYIFKKEKDPNNTFDNTTVEITVDTELLDDILVAFKEFLLGSGFYIGGEIEISEEE